MSGTLNEKTPKATWKSLLRVDNDAGGIDATLRTVTDGEGSETPLQLSTDAINIDLTGGQSWKLNGSALSVTVLALLAGANATAMRSTLGAGAAGDTIYTAASYGAVRTLLNLVVGTDVQAYHANLAALSGLTGAADRVPYFTGAGAMALATFTTAGRNLVDDADATAQRATLGLVIGTNVQAYDAELAAIAGLTSAADRLPYFTGSGTAALATFTTAGRNLVDDADAAAQRTTLGSTVVGDAVFIAASQAAARSAIGTVIGTDVQAADATLTALAGLNTTAGLLIQTGTDTFTKRTLQPPAAGMTITNPAGTAGDPTFALANDLAALEAIAVTGIPRRTGTDAWSGGAGASHLSDYEEGSWTPTLIGTSTPGTQTYSVQVGRYLRIGNLVIFHGRVTITAKDGAIAGNVAIGGLPYTARNVTNLNPAISIAQIGGLTFGTSDTQIGGIVVNNATTIQFITLESGQVGGALPVANMAASSDCIFSGSYFIN